MSGPSSVTQSFGAFTVCVQMAMYGWSDDAEADARAHEEEERRLEPFVERIGSEVQLELKRACIEVSRFELAPHSKKLFQFALEYGPHPRDYPQRKNNPCRVLFRIPAVLRHEEEEIVVFIDVALARLPEVGDIDLLAERLLQAVCRVGGAR